MRTTLAAVALATIIASPAFAQSYDPDLGSGNIAAQVTAPALRSTPYVGAHGAYAQVPHRGPVAGHSFNRNRGAFDPDPNIRFQLNRESEQGRW
jgi:hypothetical protein